MREICVVLARPGTGPEQVSLAVAALASRGMELFAERPLEMHAQPNATALICFNPLINADDPPGEVFAHPSIDGAAYHLGATLGPTAHNLKFATSAEQAAALVASTLTAKERATLRERIALRRTRMETTEPVLAVLSRHRHRAKVELVEWEGIKAVKKTFLATATQHMANEIAFHDDIAPLSPVPARILHRTNTALYYEYIQERPMMRRFLGKSIPRLLTSANLVQLADFARLVTRRGWDPIDLTPRDNVLIDARDGRLRCIDFEFARRVSHPLKPEDAAFLSGIAYDDKDADLFDRDMRQDPFAGKWRPYTGVSLKSFLQDPPRLQLLKRGLIHPAWLCLRALGSPKRRNAYLKRRAALLSALALEDLIHELAALPRADSRR